ncbi:MAG: hypothetical protein ACJ74X_09145 [Gaiellaceae bacterium]
MIAALFGVGVLTGGGDSDDEKPSTPPLDVERVAQRLERVRKLEFEQIPPVRTISADEARDEGLAELDENYPQKRRAADEQILMLLGLLPEGSDVRELAGTIFGEEVAGFYDDRTKEMTLVEGASGGTEGEITLAHELTHALEDQHFGIKPESGLDDARTAHTALVEGTATISMADYASRYLTGGLAKREDFLDQLALTDLLGGSSNLPPYMQHSLLFPYAAGARFVDAIGTWGPANAALRRNRPLSTEQILHPAKYRARERPLAVDPAPAPDAGWKRVTHGTIGEFDTAELIRTSDSVFRATRAAAGWGGGRYDLWQHGDESVLELAWRWDTKRDAAEFASALPRYVEHSLDGVPTEIDVGPTVRLTIGPAK